MALSLRQIQYFIASAEAGKLSLAASQLGVSQSAVTEAIQALEQETGVALLHRHAKGIELTFEGNQFLRHARAVVTAVSDATQAPRQARSGVAGSFSLAMTFTVAGYFLPAPLARFRRILPDVQVNLFEMDRADIERQLVAGKIDLAVILTSNLSNTEQIESEELIRSRRRLWAPPNHPLLQARRATLAEIAPEPYIMLTVDEADKTAMRYWKRTRYRPNVAFRTSSVEAVRSMVATGAGVSILSDMVYRPWSLEGDRIAARTIHDAVPSMDVGLAWKRESHLNPCAQAFRDFCHNTYNASGGELA
ncbi:MAG TPA: LysR family transcriptional regulator [Verrucomicrobiae bacterium]|jgi:DNA-binding transcriptional LysR family regulator|nr:LysR family transcriptional regulator [Verrucomicrobiae bacterium]